MTASPIAAPEAGRLDALTAVSVWDLLVVGGGTAGIVAAKTAAGFGASVLLAERDRTGGDCLWTGCVPSKALLAASAAAAAASSAEVFGVHVGGVRVDFAAVMGHVRAAIASIEPADSPDTLTEAGVRVVPAGVRFTGPGTADVGGQKVRFRQAVVATGSEPVVPPIPGLDQAQSLTSDTVWSLTALPLRLAVLGGGSIGCELGQAFARLGSQVAIIEAAPRLLPREDPAAAEAVAAALVGDGITIRTSASVVTVQPTGAGAGVIELADGDLVEFDRLLVAVGRRPRSHGLGLDEAHVKRNDRGYVVVDAHLRSTNRRVWAAGDVTGHPQYTHTAGVHGSLAASNAVLGLRRRVELSAMPRVTFTQPELAAVGVGTDRADDSDLTVRTVANARVDRAVTDGHTDGLTRLVLDRKGHLLGATVVGLRAGETLAELVLAIRRGLRTRDLAATIHAYPTYSYGPWDAAIADTRARLARPATARAVAALTGIRRRWIDARDWH